MIILPDFLMTSAGSYSMYGFNVNSLDGLEKSPIVSWCYSERKRKIQGFQWVTKSFAEFILSRTLRSFASLRMTGGEGLKMTRAGLRMTGGEGFRMTNIEFSTLRHSLSRGRVFFGFLFSSELTFIFY